MAFCDKKSNGNQMPKHWESIFYQKATNRYRPGKRPTHVKNELPTFWCLGNRINPAIFPAILEFLLWNAPTCVFIFPAFRGNALKLPNCRIYSPLPTMIANNICSIPVLSQAANMSNADVLAEGGMNSVTQSQTMFKNNLCIGYARIEKRYR